MKYRPQRGGLAESMAKTVELRATIEALGEYLCIDPFAIEVKPYCYDDRTGWKTYLVTVDGQAVGFTDSPCTENEQEG